MIEAKRAALLLRQRRRRSDEGERQQDGQCHGFVRPAAGSHIAPPEILFLLWDGSVPDARRLINTRHRDSAKLRWLALSLLPEPLPQMSSALTLLRFHLRVGVVAPQPG